MKKLLQLTKLSKESLRIEVFFSEVFFQNQNPSLGLILSCKFLIIQCTKKQVPKTKNFRAFLSHGRVPSNLSRKKERRKISGRVKIGTLAWQLNVGFNKLAAKTRHQN